MKFIVRLVLLTGIIFAGIYALPQGPQKLEYIMFRLFGVQFEAQEPLVEEVIETETEVEVEIEIEESARPQVSVNNNSKLNSNRAAVMNLIGDNYLDAVLSAGKLERWNPGSFPLKVYIQAGADIPAEYVQEVKNAFSQWQTATKGFVTFVYTSSAQDADYKCIFSGLKNRNCDEKGAGTAAYQYFEYDNSGNIKYSIVEFSPYSCTGQKWSPEIFYSTALHEIGHGLGLRGHSTRESDLMYPVSNGKRERSVISDADMTTLRAVYSIVPDVTNIPFTEDDKKGLITTADLWGEDAQRADFTIQKIKDNIALTPNNPALYAELARAYRDKKDYNSAVEAYSKALKLVDNSETASALLFDASTLYMELGKLESAEKCINKAASYGKSEHLFPFYNTLGVKYAQQKEFNKAALMLDNAVRFAQNDEDRKMVYQNYRWLGWVQKDKVMFEKYNKLLK